MVTVTVLSLLFLAVLASPATTAAADNGGGVAPTNEAAALLRFKSSLSDPTNDLAAWSPSSTSLPCNASGSWPGLQCYDGVLVGLRLAHLNLSGELDFAALAQLPTLHSINLKRNSFSGPLPESLAALRSLRALYLSHNAFSGPMPSNIFSSMGWLKKLYLDHNNFTGFLPAADIATSPRLLELHLEHNQLEGSLPATLPSSLRDFNVSHNRLSGEISHAIATRYNASAFAGNAGLCGPPGNSISCAAATPAPVSSSFPPTTEADIIAVEEETSVLVVVGIVVLVITLVTAAMVLMLRQHDNAAFLHIRSNAGSEETTAPLAPVGAVAVAVGSSHGGSSRSSRRKVGELVLMSKEKGGFGLQELMKANAVVLGNGTLGSVYKVAMRNGLTVAVKRMRDMNRAGLEEFEEQVQLLGELRHPNVLTPIGYHYRKEEKLIVSEYMPSGSLLYVLHGDQSPNRTILDWPARLKIAVGIARGMAYLHEKLGGVAGRVVSMDGADFDAPPPPPPHGNLKSGNVLLDATLEPRIVDYGFFPLVNAAQAPQAMFAFRSPEGGQHRAVSTKSDVFCLGVVLLELVTGKFPAQYLLNARGGTDVVQWAAAAKAEQREEELVDPVIAAGAGEAAVRLLLVGVTCTDIAPDRRPSMAEVAAMVEEIAAAGR